MVCLTPPPALLCCQVWQFVLQEATMRVNATGGAPKKGAEVPADKLKLVCVDIKLAPTDKQ